MVQIAVHTKNDFVCERVQNWTVACAQVVSFDRTCVCAVRLSPSWACATLSPFVGVELTLDQFDINLRHHNRNLEVQNKIRPAKSRKKQQDPTQDGFCFNTNCYHSDCYDGRRHSYRGITNGAQAPCTCAHTSRSTNCSRTSWSTHWASTENGVWYSLIVVVCGVFPYVLDLAWSNL